MGSIGIVSLNQLGEIEDRFTAEQQFQLLRCDAPEGRVPRRQRPRSIPSPSDPLVRGLPPMGRTRIRGSMRDMVPVDGLWLRGWTRTLRLLCDDGCSSGGGDEETRTPDPLLAKEMLCQLSYVPAPGWVGEWWASLDSNQRPLPYQGSALTS
jgi:hypothetical protein